MFIQVHLEMKNDFYKTVPTVSEISDKLHYLKNDVLYHGTLYKSKTKRLLQVYRNL